MIDVRLAAQHESADDVFWFCVRTLPSSEHIARRHFESWIEQIYMPECERPALLETTKLVPDPDSPGKMKTQSTGLQRVKGPVLRGYLFIKLHMSPAAANEIANTRGVLKLVPDNWNPRPISDEEFDKLKKACDALTSASETEVDYSYMISKIWRVKSGTYAGYQGECDSVRKGFAVLKLGMFKSEIPVPVPIEDIDPIPVTPAQETHVVKVAMFGYKGKQKIASRGQ